MKMNMNPSINRRTMLGLVTGLAVTGVASRFGVNPAMADAAATDKMMAEVLKGAEAKAGGIKLDVPEIAENGNTVPVGFVVDNPMTADNYVKAVHVFADGNPSPEVASFEFTPMSGEAGASFRMRLAKTQNVIAVAELSDGSFLKASAKVKVTIGGCGG
jgi:sulfur-oxidizing protein SoxY